MTRIVDPFPSPLSLSLSRDFVLPFSALPLFEPLEHVDTRLTEQMLLPSSLSLAAQALWGDESNEEEARASGALSPAVWSAAAVDPESSPEIVIGVGGWSDSNWSGITGRGVEDAGLEAAVEFADQSVLAVHPVAPHSPQIENARAFPAQQLALAAEATPLSLFLTHPSTPTLHTLNRLPSSPVIQRCAREETFAGQQVVPADLADFPPTRRRRLERLDI